MQSCRSQHSAFSIVGFLPSLVRIQERAWYMPKIEASSVLDTPRSEIKQVSGCWFSADRFRQSGMDRPFDPALSEVRQEQDDRFKNTSRLNSLRSTSPFSTLVRECRSLQHLLLSSVLSSALSLRRPDFRAFHHYHAHYNRTPSVVQDRIQPVYTSHGMSLV